LPCPAPARLPFRVRLATSPHIWPDCSSPAFWTSAV
jgi:hypothetical protein